MQCVIFCYFVIIKHLVISSAPRLRPTKQISNFYKTNIVTNSPIQLQHPPVLLDEQWTQLTTCLVNDQYPEAGILPQVTCDTVGPQWLQTMQPAPVLRQRDIQALIGKPFEQRNQKPFEQPLQKTLQQSIQSQYQQPIQKQFQHPAMKQYQESAITSFQQPVQKQFQQSYQQPFQQPIPQPFQHSLQQPYQQLSRKPFQQSFEKLFQQPFQKLFQQPTQEQFRQPIQKPFQQPVPKPFQPPIQKPFQPPVPKPFQPLIQKPLQPPIQKQFQQSFQNPFEEPAQKPPQQSSEKPFQQSDQPSFPTWFKKPSLVTLQQPIKMMNQSLKSTPETSSFVPTTKIYIYSSRKKKPRGHLRMKKRRTSSTRPPYLKGTKPIDDVSYVDDIVMCDNNAVCLKHEWTTPNDTIPNPANK